MITECSFDGLDAWRLEDEGATAIVAARGATLLSWDPGVGESLIAGFESAQELLSGKGSRAAILAPFPGRIRSGSFTFSGRKVQLETQADGHARHGFISKATFTREGDGPILRLKAVYDGSGDWPWPFTFYVIYTLTRGDENEAHLTIDMELVNDADEPAPASLGWHPLLRLPGMETNAKLAVSIPARMKIATTKDHVPMPGEAAYAGMPNPVDIEYLGKTELDDIYTGLIPSEDGTVHSSISDPVSGAKLILTQEPAQAPVLVAWTADGMARGARRALALEPLSHMPDAVNRADCQDTIGLAPGQVREMTATLTYCPPVPEL